MRIQHIALLLAIIALAFSIFSLNETLTSQEKLKKDIQELRLENQELQGEVYRLKQDLITNISELDSEISTLQNEFETTIQTQQQKLKELNQSLVEFEALLADRINWIKSNANISEVPYYEDTKTKLYKCYDGRINLGCLWFLLHDKEGIDYIYEGKNDQLTNLSVIYQRKGGDCEDLSLLYAATVRYAMQKYGNKFVAWKPGTGKFIIYSGDQYRYYMPNAEEFEFEASHVYVTCYGSGEEGHCAVSFCEKEVTSVDELYNCTLIEPQSYGMLSEVEGKIWFYISADDLCMDVNETKCFSDFLHELYRLQSS